MFDLIFERTFIYKNCDRLNHHEWLGLRDANVVASGVGVRLKVGDKY